VKTSKPFDLHMGDLLDIRQALQFRIEHMPPTGAAHKACLKGLLAKIDGEIKRREAKPTGGDKR